MAQHVHHLLMIAWCIGSGPSVQNLRLYPKSDLESGGVVSLGIQLWCTWMSTPVYGASYTSSVVLAGEWLERYRVWGVPSTESVAFAGRLCTRRWRYEKPKKSCILHVLAAGVEYLNQGRDCRCAARGSPFPIVMGEECAVCPVLGTPYLTRTSIYRRPRQTASSAEFYSPSSVPR